MLTRKKSSSDCIILDLTGGSLSGDDEVDALPSAILYCKDEGGNHGNGIVKGEHDSEGSRKSEGKETITDTDVALGACGTEDADADTAAHIPTDSKVDINPKAEGEGGCEGEIEFDNSDDLEVQIMSVGRGSTSERARLYTGTPGKEEEGPEVVTVSDSEECLGGVNDDDDDDDDDVQILIRSSDSAPSKYSNRPGRRHSTGGTSSSSRNSNFSDSTWRKASMGALGNDGDQDQVEIISPSSRTHRTAISSNNSTGDRCTVDMSDDHTMITGSRSISTNGNNNRASCSSSSSSSSSSSIVKDNSKNINNNNDDDDDDDDNDDNDIGNDYSNHGTDSNANNVNSMTGLLSASNAVIRKQPRSTPTRERHVEKEEEKEEAENSAVEGSADEALDMRINNNTSLNGDRRSSPVVKVTGSGGKGSGRGRKSNLDVYKQSIAGSPTPTETNQSQSDSHSQSDSQSQSSAVQRNRELERKQNNAKLAFMIARQR
jgi:hypothetical protein